MRKKGAAGGPRAPGEIRGSTDILDIASSCVRSIEPRGWCCSRPSILAGQVVPAWLVVAGVTC